MEDPGKPDQGRQGGGPPAAPGAEAPPGLRVARAGQTASHPGTAWVILAAGMGTRMRSERPKVLHPLCGRPLGAFSLEAARRWRPGQVIVVTGHKADEVERELGSWARRLGVAVDFVRQQPQLGTGDAVRRAMPALRPDIDEVAVSYADVPLLSADTLAELCDLRRSSGAAAAILTATLDDPTGYGRVLRSPADPSRVVGIVEERDATPEQRAIREVNAGVYAFRRDALEQALERLRPDNAQREYYLTDTVGLLASLPPSSTPDEQGAGGHRVVALPVRRPVEIAGVNDRRQLRALERTLREAVRQDLMAAGVTMTGEPDPVVDPWASVGADTVLKGGAAVLGQSRVGRRCEIGPGAVLVDCELEDDVVVEGVHLVGCRIGAGAAIGPGAWIPPGAVVKAGARIGHVTRRAAAGEGGF